MGFRQIVLVGHPGKLIKIAAGIFHTHSHIADARMETLVAHLALLGAPLELLTLVGDCDTTEAAMEHIEAYGFGHIYNHLAKRICWASHADAALYQNAACLRRHPVFF
ncbi:cobalt-precorrin-6A synthase [Salmonella enterica subsp. arizonae]|uniref:Cobalt-precorrin-6A synthase n=1 Tax=Salmonella enterica subsp. arizonae TaxID=59203 RepID=A0A379TAF8_SALER|nr:cobalt-precorrin-6A synthase [Salmonella enterica subsp. arizonae]